MAKTYWTEKETERYLQPETRMVRLPGGRTRTVTCFRLVWKNLDGLLYYKIFPEEQLAGWAEGIARETGQSFESCFHWIVGDAFGSMCLIDYEGGIPAAYTATPRYRS